MTAPPVYVVQYLGTYIRAFVQAIDAALDPLGYDRGATLTSWYRSPADNQRVGGEPRSQHLLGLAADIVFPTIVKASAMRSLRAQGLTVLDEGDHVHVQAYPASQIPDHVYRAMGVTV